MFNGQRTFYLPVFFLSSSHRTAIHVVIFRGQIRHRELTSSRWQPPPLCDRFLRTQLLFHLYLLWRNEHGVRRWWFRGVLHSLGFSASGHHTGDEPLFPSGASIQHVGAVRTYYGLDPVPARSCNCSVPTHDGLKCLCHGPWRCPVPVHHFNLPFP